MTSHRSRLCHFVVDVDDLDQGVAFWSAALGAKEEPVSEGSSHVYRRLRLPDCEVRVLLQATTDPKTHKERMHLDIESNDVEAEVARLEALGAIRWDHQQERGYDFWVLRDPWGNEFCVLQPTFPELLHPQQDSELPSREPAGSMHLGPVSLPTYNPHTVVFLVMQELTRAGVKGGEFTDWEALEGAEKLLRGLGVQPVTPSQQ